jgi:hypothetical protein
VSLGTYDKKLRRTVYPWDSMELIEEAYSEGEDWGSAESRLYRDSKNAYWLYELDGCSCVSSDDGSWDGPYESAMAAVAMSHCDRREDLTAGLREKGLIK